MQVPWREGRFAGGQAFHRALIFRGGKRLVGEQALMDGAV
ncbi:hypothetical protein BN2364_3072 [Alloalcanivorax xenomutans]|nr:hypothetical protein BN2364_3072 [Alloalcanivorax xenomutans]